MKANVDIGDREVHIWQASISKQSPRLPQLYGLLSAEERRRAEAFTREEPRRSFIVGRGALRSLLGTYLGEEAAAVRLAKTGRGKPIAARDAQRDEYASRGLGSSSSDAARKELRARLHFSVSHSGDLVLIALSATWEIGVDVELVRSMELEPLLPLCLAQEEADLFGPLDEGARRKRFFDLWTRKEALAKAIGLGIALPLREIVFAEAVDRDPRVGGARAVDSALNSVGKAEDAPAALVLASAPEAAGDPRRWRVVPIEVGEGYAAAVAIPGSDPLIQLRRFEG